MVDDTLYITPHETALAVVATSMKKSRLRLDTLIVDSIMGGILFSTGGMLYVMCEAQDQGLIDNGCTGIVSLFQGAVYALGLFFVIQTGMELFNSNVLFFTVGLLRGAISIVDLLISWIISFWVNLASTVFVVYLICYLSGIFKESAYVEGTVRIATRKDAASFMETFLRAIAGNFCVCLATYMQMMVKPPHIKFLLIFLPIFTFVAMGFTHVVADMFLVPAGIFNNCGYGFGHYFWKIMIPGALGNIVGGAFFAIMIPWYLHLVVIEQDMKRLNLPAYEEKDEQPMLNMDSRVVRIRKPEEGAVSDDETSSPSLEDEKDGTRSYRPEGITHSLTRCATHKQIRSPRGVFPVAGMGAPLRKEKTIASAYTGALNSASINDSDSNTEETQSNADTVGDDNEILEDNPYDAESNKMSTNLMRVITRAHTNVHRDIESAIEPNEGNSHMTALQRLKTRVKEAKNTKKNNKDVNDERKSRLDKQTQVVKKQAQKIVASRNMEHHTSSSSSSSPSHSNSVRSLTPAMFTEVKEEPSRKRTISRLDKPRRDSYESYDSEDPISVISDNSFENGYRGE